MAARCAAAHLAMRDHEICALNKEACLACKLASVALPTLPRVGTLWGALMEGSTVAESPVLVLSKQDTLCRLCNRSGTGRRGRCTRRRSGGCDGSCTRGRPGRSRTSTSCGECSWRRGVGSRPSAGAPSAPGGRRAAFQHKEWECCQFCGISPSESQRGSGMGKPGWQARLCSEWSSTICCYG